MTTAFDPPNRSPELMSRTPFGRDTIAPATALRPGCWVRVTSQLRTLLLFSGGMIAFARTRRRA